MKCYFCGREGSVPCTWMGYKFHSGHMFQVKPGDVIRMYESSGVYVVKVEPVPPGIYLTTYTQDPRYGQLLRITYRMGKSDRRAEFFERAGVRILGRARCDQPACEAHVRDVGGNARYCRMHWDSWSKTEDEQRMEVAI